MLYNRSPHFVRTVVVARRKAMTTTYSEVFVQLVWSTLGRTPWITEELEKPLYYAMTKKCQDLGCPPIALGGTDDHVHVLVSLARDVSIATLAKDVKGSSAHFVTHHLTANPIFRWQRGYGAFSIRKTDIPTVRNYILHQKQHHLANTIASDWEPRVDDSPHPPSVTRS